MENPPWMKMGISYWNMGIFQCHPGKLTWPLKINGWKMYFLLYKILPSYGDMLVFRGVTSCKLPMRLSISSENFAGAQRDRGVFFGTFLPGCCAHPGNAPCHGQSQHLCRPAGGVFFFYVAFPMGKDTRLVLGITCFFWVGGGRDVPNISVDILVGCEWKEPCFFFWKSLKLFSLYRHPPR